MKTALLLIDIQKDYFEGGKYELFKSDEAVKKALNVLNYFRNENLPVFHIRHISSKENATFFKKDTAGAEIHNLLTPIETESVIIKSFPNSFRNTNLQDELNKQKVTNLVVAGMMSHHCVDSTVRSAFDIGYKITLLHDACATRDLEFNNNLISAEQVHSVFMASLGRGFSNVISTSEFILKSGNSITDV